MPGSLFVDFTASCTEKHRTYESNSARVNGTSLSNDNGKGRQSFVGFFLAKPSVPKLRSEY